MHGHRHRGVKWCQFYKWGYAFKISKGLFIFTWFISVYFASQWNFIKANAKREYWFVIYMMSITRWIYMELHKFANILYFITFLDSLENSTFFLLCIAYTKIRPFLILSKKRPFARVGKIKHIPFIRFLTSQLFCRLLWIDSLTFGSYENLE